MDRCIALCKDHCRGCLLRWKSGFLHEHEQLSLLDKLELYLELVREKLVGGELESLYKLFTKNETLSTPKNELLEQTQSMISHASPRSLYYGRWITIEHEIIFQNIFMKRKRNIKKREHKKNLSHKQKRLCTKDNVVVIESNQQVPSSDTQNQQTFEDIFWECLNENE